jgi:hypothetical protein
MVATNSSLKRSVFFFFMLTTIFLTLTGCSATDLVDTITDKTEKPPMQTTTIPVISQPDPSPGAPSLEELFEGNFTNPELPRIAAERLKQFMDNGVSLVLVDTRIEFLFNLGHLPQSINLPFKPKDEQVADFLLLPKDRFIIFYCD